MSLRSPAFRHDEFVPTRYTCDGENVAPALEWSGAPEAALSYALIMDDPDAPDGTFTHWLLWNIPASTTGLGEGGAEDGKASAKIRAGRNDFQKPGYGGPCPPAGHGDHRYRFQLFALDVEVLDLAEGSIRGDLERVMEGHVVAETVLQGRYRRGKHLG